MKRRAYIGLKTKLAAALTALGRVPYDDYKSMSEDQFLSLWTFDHWPFRHADGGPDEFWNLTPRFIQEHREKTKRDQAEMGKSRRIRKRLGAFDPRSPVCLVEAVAADRAGLSGPRYRPKPKRRIPSRPFPKGRKFNRRGR